MREEDVGPNSGYESSSSAHCGSCVSDLRAKVSVCQLRFDRPPFCFRAEALLRRKGPCVKVFGARLFEALFSRSG